MIQTGQLIFLNCPVVFLPHHNLLKMTNKISVTSKILLIISAVLLVISLFVPLWQIDLDAPQYPEGLMLEIWANKIAGNVDIINGLNHYIGMKTLHTEDFIEFKILPYIISIYAVLFLLTAWIARKKMLYAALILFIVFGVVSMVDFWMWEYDYGHNLDPNAAIQVPGMAYQPPLIGFKQLLNFGAYSMPSTGGWCFVIAGLLVLFAVAKEAGWLNKFIMNKKKTLVMTASFALLFMASCNNHEPQPIKLNTDNCDYCRMTISDGKFAAEIITQKGRVYKFDDLSCMLDYASEQDANTVKNYYVNDYLKNNELIDATASWYVHHNKIKSPMSGNTAAFSSEENAREYAAELNVKPFGWAELNNENSHEHHH